MSPSPSWFMARFTALKGPVYIDLLQVAAVLQTPRPAGGDGEPALPVMTGATIVLFSGWGCYVEESADAVFEEVHRARTKDEPEKPSFRSQDETR